MFFFCEQVSRVFELSPILLLRVLSLSYVTGVFSVLDICKRRKLVGFKNVRISGNLKNLEELRTAANCLHNLSCLLYLKSFPSNFLVLIPGKSTENKTTGQNKSPL